MFRTQPIPLPRAEAVLADCERTEGRLSTIQHDVCDLARVLQDLPFPVAGEPCASVATWKYDPLALSRAARTLGWDDEKARAMLKILFEYVKVSHVCPEPTFDGITTLGRMSEWLDERLTLGDLLLFRTLVAIDNVGSVPEGLAQMGLVGPDAVQCFARYLSDDNHINAMIDGTFPHLYENETVMRRARRGRELLYRYLERA